jgi:hypothetical protein
VQIGTDIENSVLTPECVFGFHVVKHHFSYKSMDRSSPLMKIFFPDPAIALKFSSAQTKTEATVNSVLAPESKRLVQEAFQPSNIPFCSISTGRSNHGSIKVFPILIQYFDFKNSGTQSKFIELKNILNETSNTIAVMLIDASKTFGILN